jgi:hypothetical protein
MSFLAPWALAVGALGALGVVLLHLVARQRPAAYLFPTTRFVPDKRTLVSRAATRPRDLLLLVLRVLLLLAASAAFARPVLTPRRGAVARIVLLDRSRSVASPAEVVSRARSIASDGAPTVFIPFDSVPSSAAAATLDSVAVRQKTSARGSLSAALVAARRAGVAIADRADSVQLVLISPLAADEVDAASARLRAEWPGTVRLERVALAADSTSWQLERGLPVSDVLGPAVATLGPGRVKTRLVRTAFSATDSAFARDGSTVVRWDSAAATHPTPEGLSVSGNVIVASLERSGVPAGRVVARWADGVPAASEQSIGSGCLRTIGVSMPAAGDLALHPPFQRVVRALLAPCGFSAGGVLADSSVVKMIAGSRSAAAPGSALRIDESRPSPLARWLLGLALVLALAELYVRSRGNAVPA